MKDSHLYKRLDNNYSFRSIVTTIAKHDFDVVTEMFNNLTNEAYDHPRYNHIKSLYEERVKNERSKE